VTLPAAANASAISPSVPSRQNSSGMDFASCEACFVSPAAACATAIRPSANGFSWLGAVRAFHWGQCAPSRSGLGWQPACSPGSGRGRLDISVSSSGQREAAKTLFDGGGLGSTCAIVDFACVWRGFRISRFGRTSAARTRGNSVKLTTRVTFQMTEVAVDIRRHSVADHPPAGTTCVGLRGVEGTTRDRGGAAEALAYGETAEQVKAEGTVDWLVPHRVFEGNRPSNMILTEQLAPETLRKLVALYEHSVHSGHHLDHRFLRSMGCRGEAIVATNYPRTREPRRTGSCLRQLNQQPIRRYRKL
jgi:hypothetical protein